ncbi:site-specific integrase [Ruminococcus albus]|uniref:Integrase family protein n=1 Tax=Ruminococcus albus (strain ATCC 27210 / DSM 20455 / JCM 14654 / NCDO 2250 / 7) TaxID=697329 RepID=E6UEV1_RUMA7|nr:site-specific integrase [Ruminococcus albus]ADU22950.1 integrase family protein [Ruminococcus albus 7 = DSM 20455]
MAKKKSNTNCFYVGDRQFNAHIADNGNYYIQADFGKDESGKRIRKKVTAKSLNELSKKVEELIIELESNHGDNITLVNAFESYINTHASLAYNTLNSYRNTIKYYFKELQNKPIRQITKSDLMQAINTDIAKGCAKTTMKREFTVLCVVLNYFEVPALTPKVQKELKSYVNNATYIGKGRKKDFENLPTALDVVEWLKADTTKYKDRTAVCVLLGLHSLRVEEVRGLKFKDVIKEKNGNCYVNIHATKTCIRGKDHFREETKNEYSTRRFLIDNRLYDMIHSIEHKSDDDFVISICNWQYGSCIKQLAIKNGYDWITAHILRHIFISDNKDCTIAEIVGGWSLKGGVSKTVYTHARHEEKEKLTKEYSGKLLDCYFDTEKDSCERNITWTVNKAV